MTSQQAQVMVRENTVPLDRLPAGSGGVIADIDVAEADLARLEVMGVCPGRHVQVVKGGDPLIVRVLGTRIGLAAALATFVYVRGKADSR